jgi:formylglycine-generating enzyme required for sulfatase activity
MNAATHAAAARAMAVLAIGTTLLATAALAAEIRIGPVPPEERERLGLADVYTQYVRAAEGIPVVATARVRPQAVAEAAWLIDRMLATRPDVARAIARSPVRFVVMAHDEFTTDVPEHAGLKPQAFWNKRARGLGATLARPATSCGEENLLCFPGDPYATENILIHEFGHTIHEFGLAQADPTFQRRLEAAFADARKHGRWQGTYGATNVVEYWAEGVQSWFSCNRTGDHQHGEINSPAAVRDHDPPLAALLEEAFGAEPWCYVRPHDRAAIDREHLAGFDPASAPAFDWKNMPDRDGGKPASAAPPPAEAPASSPMPADQPAAAPPPPRAVAPFDGDRAAAAQREWAAHAGLPARFTNSAGMTFVIVPPGEFTMGSPDDEPRRLPEETPHRVVLTRPFYLATCEVTQGQWETLMGDNPAYWSPEGYKRKRGKDLDTSRFPVEKVCWLQAVEFCRKLSRQPDEKAAGRVYRLPTEAEWEFACRAGTETPYHFGATHDGSRANSFGGAPYGVEKKGPYLNRPCDVASYAANAFGLHDMHGSMWEWCADGYAEDAYKTAAVEDPCGSDDAPARVIRGGAWRFSCDSCRSAVRHGYDPRIRAYDVGFRVALDLPVSPDREAAREASQ